MLLKPTETHFDRAEWSASSETAVTNEDVFKEVSNNMLLKALLHPSLSNTCRTRKRTARDVLFQQLGYQRLSSRYSVSSDVDLCQK